MKYHVLILSLDDVFARMLELELSMCGIPSHIAAQARTGDTADLVLLDLDSAMPPKGEAYAHIIGFTRNFSISAVDPDRICSMILHRPFEMRILREEVQALLSDKVSGHAKTELLLGETYLSCEKGQITLTPNEKKVLECLLTHRGESVSKEVLSALIGESGTNKLEV